MEKEINEYEWILAHKPLHYDDRQFKDLLNEDNGVRKMLTVVDRRLHFNSRSLKRLDDWRYDINAESVKIRKDIKICHILLILQGVAIILLNLAFIIYVI